MTEKEKAEELFNRFDIAGKYLKSPDEIGYKNCYLVAKQCALICVDEILNGSHIWNKIEGGDRVFWNKVRIEIEEC